MDIAEFLKIADDLMFNSTSKYLDNLQKSVVEGVWNGKSYQEIAVDTDRTEGHIRDIAATLWKDISKPIGGKVRKSNFRSTIERNHFFNYQDIFHVENMNFCSERMDINYPPEKLRKKIAKRTKSSDRGKVKNRDVGGIRDLFPFYGRDRELEQLEQWILDDDCRLIDIYGMSGIGKTALMRQLAAQIGDEFDRVVWANLRSDRSVIEFIDRDLSPYFSIAKRPTKAVDPSANPSWDLEQHIAGLMEQLSKYRCLIILDNLHQIFSSGDLAGVYSDNCRGYQELFRQFGDANHQSCILLVGWEEPRDFSLLAGETRLVRSLALDGLRIEAQQQLLTDRGMVNSDDCSKQFGYYCGNPLYLNMVATIVKDCFDSNINGFAKDCGLFLTNDIKLILQSQLDRLSSIEREIIETISAENRALSFVNLISVSQVLSADLLDALQSLKRRKLVVGRASPVENRQETELGIVFDLEPIIRSFICLVRL
jgi:AAA ATPase domain